MRNTKSAIKTLPTALLCLAILLSLAMTATAAPIDLDKRGSLTVTCSVEGEALSGVELRLYRVADVKEESRFRMNETFAPYKVTFNGKDSATWAAAAHALYGYVLRDKIRFTSRVVTDLNGKAVFRDLAPGVFLVSAVAEKRGDTLYTADAFLAVLPRPVGIDWSYHVSSAPKIRKTTDTDTPVELKVIKVWRDDGNEPTRPKEITVQLLGDGAVEQTVPLNAGNNWRYEWTGLDPAKRWTVVEQTAPAGYTVASFKEGVTITVTNTKEKPEEPDKPPVPDTGLLWWPVFVLAAAGGVSLLLGVLFSRRKKTDE